MFKTKRIILIALVFLAILYIADYLRATKGQNILGTVQVQRYYAIAEKNNKVEFVYGDSETRECVRALFPHFGDEPCWYAGRHKEEKIDE